MVERARITVLFVDGSEVEVGRAVRQLRQHELAPLWERVDDFAQLREALKRQHWDFVVCDSNVPQLGVFEALALSRELAPTTPFLVLSNRADDKRAVDVVRQGAIDFISKDDLVRLSAAIVRELGRPHRAHTTPQLAAMLVSAREAEARRIALDLHDRIGQVLAVMARTLDEAQRGDPIIRGAQLAAARLLAEEAIRNVRELSTELWPSILDDLGLLPALRWLGERYATRIGCPVNVTLDDIERLPPAIETACYRVAEAALTNVARHAHASNVSIRLRITDEFNLELAVSDDGRGFDLDAAWQRAARGESLGLVAMRERALLAGGTLSLIAAPSLGTTVLLTFSVRTN